MQTVQFKIAAEYLPALINGDTSNLDGQDEHRLESFVAQLVADHGNANITQLPGDHYPARCDVSGMFAEVYDCGLIVTKADTTPTTRFRAVTSWTDHEHDAHQWRDTFAEARGDCLDALGDLLHDATANGDDRATHHTTRAVEFVGRMTGPDLTINVADDFDQHAATPTAYCVVGVETRTATGDT